MAQHAALGAATRFRYGGSGSRTDGYQARHGRFPRKHDEAGGSGARNESSKEVEGRYLEHAEDGVSLGGLASGAGLERSRRRGAIKRRIQNSETRSQNAFR